MEAKKPDIVVMDMQERRKMSHKRYRLSLQHNSLQDLKKELKRRSHYRFREYWCPCNGVNEPEEMVTGAGRS